MTEYKMQVLNNPFFFSFAAILLGVLGSIFYRWRGMNKNDVPSLVENRQLRRVLVVSVLAAALFLATGSIWVLLAIPLGFYGIITGHGSYFSGLHHASLRDEWRNIDNENFSFITSCLSSPMDEFTRFIGMALTGLATTLPIALIPFIAYSISGEIVPISMWFILIGVLKAVIYILVAPRDTEKSEFIWGFTLVFSACFVDQSFGAWFLDPHLLIHTFLHN